LTRLPVEVIDRPPLVAPVATINGVAISAEFDLELPQRVAEGEVIYLINLYSDEDIVAFRRYMTERSPKALAMLQRQLGQSDAPSVGDQSLVGPFRVVQQIKGRWGHPTRLTMLRGHELRRLRRRFDADDAPITELTPLQYIGGSLRPAIPEEA
jgi:hypothetical protein